MFGDIVSDAFAGLVGGLGFACSGNIGDEVAVFEPTHGSAPKYEKLDPPIVNPIAMILSAAMLLDHVNEADKAERVRNAVAAVVAEGKVRPYDMMRIPGGPDSIAKGDRARWLRRLGQCPASPTPDRIEWGWVRQAAKATTYGPICMPTSICPKRET
jgi:hypothetical protein